MYAIFCFPEKGISGKSHLFFLCTECDGHFFWMPNGGFRAPRLLRTYPEDTLCPLPLFAYTGCREAGYALRLGQCWRGVLSSLDQVQGDSTAQAGSHRPEPRVLFAFT